VTVTCVNKFQDAYNYKDQLCPETPELAQILNINVLFTHGIEM